jgi:hypothetical protein
MERPTAGHGDHRPPELISRLIQGISSFEAKRSDQSARAAAPSWQRVPARDQWSTSDVGYRRFVFPSDRLGIECKGPPYHSQPTLFSIASEDQRVKTLREEGWSIHEIESKEWFLNPEHELDKLEAMLNKVRLDS